MNLYSKNMNSILAVLAYKIVAQSYMGELGTESHWIQGGLSQVHVHKTYREPVPFGDKEASI